MTKHRLELFSDGVFAIVLTLLVLDLKLPTAHGSAELSQIAPELLVHAMTFFALGVLWMVHHGALARVLEIGAKTLLLNLFALFWVTSYRSPPRTRPSISKTPWERAFWRRAVGAMWRQS